MKKLPTIFEIIDLDEGKEKPKDKAPSHHWEMTPVTPSFSSSSIKSNAVDSEVVHNDDHAEADDNCKRCCSCFWRFMRS